MVPAARRRSTTPTRIEVGLKFRTVEEGFATGVRFYKGPGNTGTHVGHLWSATGAQLAQVTFAAETAGGWQQALFPTPVAADTEHDLRRVVLRARTGTTPATSAAWRRPTTCGRCGRSATARTARTGGSATARAASPTRRTPPPTTGSTSSSTSTTSGHPPSSTACPAPGLDGVALDAEPSVRFSEAMTGGSIVLELRDAGRRPRRGRHQLRRPPRAGPRSPRGAARPGDHLHGAGGEPPATGPGTSIAAPVEWTFTTTGDGDQYPLTVWDTSVTPATPSVDRHAARRARRQVPARRRRLRQGRALLPGPRQRRRPRRPPVDARRAAARARPRSRTRARRAGSRPTSPPPVAVVAGQTYVASYFAPAGGYSATANAFGAAGVDRGRAPRSPGAHASGGNGVFRYGSSGFPASSYNDTDYAVDVVVLRAARHHRARPSSTTRRPRGLVERGHRHDRAWRRSTRRSPPAHSA